MKIKELRKEKNWTQKEVANKLNLNQQTFNNYENEVTQPSIEILIQMAELFDCDLDYLCGNENSNKNYKYMFVSELDQQIFDNVLKLMHDDKIRVLTRLELMLEEEPYSFGFDNKEYEKQKRYEEYKSYQFSINEQKGKNNK